MLIHSILARRRRASHRTVPERGPDGFNLVKGLGARTLTATCERWTHQLGWELRLLIDGQDLHMVRVVRSAHEMATTIDEWRTDMAEFGWR
jgi:hypothetical protein